MIRYPACRQQHERGKAFFSVLRGWLLGLQAAVEVLEGKMRRLREEVCEQAATAAMLHKFNSGASEPTGEVTRSHIAQGLQATKEVGSSHWQGHLLVVRLPNTTRLGLILLYTSKEIGWWFALAAKVPPLSRNVRGDRLKSMVVLVV